MTHARNTIRNAVVTALTSLTITGSNVFSTRVKPLDDGTQLPAIVVTTLNEGYDAEESSFSAGVINQWRLLEIAITVHSRKVTGDALAVQLDDIAEDIENAINADETLGVGVKETVLVGTVFEYEPDSNAPRGEMVITIESRYRVQDILVGTIIA